MDRDGKRRRLQSALHAGGITAKGLRTVLARLGAEEKSSSRRLGFRIDGVAYKRKSEKKTGRPQDFN